MKGFIAKTLIIIAFVVAFLELVLALVTLSLYTRCWKKDDGLCFRILKLSEKYY